MSQVPEPVAPLVQRMSERLERLELLALVAEAELGRGRRGKHGISGCVLKAVLIVVATYDGQPLTARAIADRCSCGRCLVEKSLLWLRRQRFIVASRARGHGNVNCYNVVAARLRKTRCSTELVGPVGVTKEPAVAARLGGIADGRRRRSQLDAARTPPVPSLALAG